MINRRNFMLSLTAVIATSVFAAEPPLVTVYLNPT